MKLPLLLAALVLSAAIGALVARWPLGGGTPSAAGAWDGAAELAELEARLARAAEENARLERLVQERRELAQPLRAGAPGTGAARTSGEEIELALEAWVAEHLAPAASEPSPRSEEQEILATLPVGEVLSLLASSDALARGRVWRGLAEVGRMEDVLAELEARAAASEGAEAHLAYAVAAIEALPLARDLRLARELAERADGAYERALQADPDHWEARFGKAVALAQWPAHRGRRSEAIEHLEILRAEAERNGLRPEHASVYLYLGSLLQQTGAGERAVEIWREGLSLFPDDERLQGSLGR